MLLRVAMAHAFSGSSATVATLSRPERRGGPRVEVLGSLHGQLVPLRVPVRVREIGFGGFSIAAAMPLPIGVEQDFRFTLRNGSTVTVRARVVHCRPEPHDGGSIHIIGLAFAEELPERRRRAKSAIRAVDPLTV